jgi:hypothetical protein
VKLAERRQREAGLQECLNRFGTGRLKIFSHCTRHLEELRLYRRDENGRVVKENDHLMDAMRYRVMDLAGMITQPDSMRLQTEYEGM